MRGSRKKNIQVDGGVFFVVFIQLLKDPIEYLNDCWLKAPDILFREKRIQSCAAAFVEVMLF